MVDGICFIHEIAKVLGTLPFCTLPPSDNENNKSSTWTRGKFKKMFENSTFRVKMSMIGIEIWKGNERDFRLRRSNYSNCWRSIPSISRTQPEREEKSKSLLFPLNIFSGKSAYARKGEATVFWLLHSLQIEQASDWK